MELFERCVRYRIEMLGARKKVLIGDVGQNLFGSEGLDELIEINKELKVLRTER